MALPRTREEYLHHYFKYAFYLRRYPNPHLFRALEVILLNCPYPVIRTRAQQLHEEFKDRFRERSA